MIWTSSFVHAPLAACWARLRASILSKRRKLRIAPLKLSLNQHDSHATPARAACNVWEHLSYREHGACPSNTRRRGMPRI
ncbi:hypothetical protein PR003_g28165 [Phytophthora rubi]|uniref:Uncharacterized protein n=1 Tax=Phytophthora rubi TaxID=129364 RepID=A0A6A4BST0_9STRA|nr:hypothetical protein PR002_g26541 [Phytophthora rubi]KAE8973217.1 hypothetical protein PR001_g26380 [Phytophthora rubi]KAE9279693.1 hypothetical protein PR003_g28165 [Phytophthora rubi]